MYSRPEWVLASLTLIGALTFAVGCPGPGLGDSEADLVIEDLLAPTSSRLRARVPSVRREPVQYTARSRNYRGDLYRATDTPAAGIVLVPGLAPAGKDAPRLVALARTLARVRFLVLVPDVVGLRAMRVRSGDVQDLVHAVAYLRRQLPEDRAIGMAAFSFAVGPAVLAAARVEIRNRLQFVVAVGGYYDLRGLIVYSTTGDPSQPWTTGGGVRDERGKWVLVLGVVELLDSPSDRAALTRHARRILLGGDDVSLFEPPTTLQPGGRALYDLVTNTDPSRTTGLLSALPPAIRAELRALDLSRHNLSTVRANVLLVHGRADRVIPYEHSLALERALPPGRAESFIMEGLAHVDLRPAREDLDVIRSAVEALLRERDRSVGLAHRYEACDRLHKCGVDSTPRTQG